MSYLILFCALIGFGCYMDWNVMLTAGVTFGGLAIWFLLMNRRLAIPK
ncbi:hypothetical protein [Blastopirellula marina]|uniref:Uncharacterized protein n=1 Tax=Blastopirellula marina DSM 3645 TaxID=314230 RepID=A3ZS22_9BACT|nr:hypothetical protein [Blastopirellula marina]EAQ80945.1 hypothetical protein DSM3645_13031 [Blastopirellula marina DSM 3645]